MPHADQAVSPTHLMPSPNQSAIRQPKRLAWPLAVPVVVLFWILPRRTGPALTSVRWPGVLLVWVFWTIYGAGCVMMGDSPWGWVHLLTGHGPGEPLDWALLSQVARGPLAEVATRLQASDPVPWQEIGGFAGLSLACIAMAVGSGPLLTEARRLGELISRRAKLGLLCMTVLFPAAMLAEAVDLVFTRPSDATGWAFVLACIGWMHLLLRGGRDRTGPNRQSEALPQLLCEHCGYSLLGLSAEGRCPECGTSITDSSPEHRMPPPRSWFRSFARGVAGSNFFRQIRLHDPGPARELLGRTLIWSMILLAVAGGLLGDKDRGRSALSGACVALVPLVITLAVITPGLHRLLVPHRATIWCYGLSWISGLLIPPALLACTLVLIGYGMTILGHADVLHNGQGHLSDPVSDTIVLTVHCLTCVCVGLALFTTGRISQGLRENRFANA